MPPMKKQKMKLSRSQRPKARIDGGSQYSGTNSGSVNPRRPHAKLPHQNSWRFLGVPRVRTMNRTISHHANRIRQPNKYGFIERLIRMRCSVDKVPGTAHGPPVARGLRTSNVGAAATERRRDRVLVGVSV